MLPKAALLRALVLALVALSATAQNVPFTRIKPALHRNGIMRYTIALVGRGYCAPNTRGYLTAPFCDTWELVPNASPAAMMAATNSSRGVSPASLVATAKQVTAAAVQQCPPGVFCQVPDDGTIYTRPPDPPSTKHCSMTQWTWCKVRGKWCKCYADGSIRRMIYLPVPELYGWQALNFGQWELVNRAPLNPDGSAWGLPLIIRNVGRQGVCYYQYLTAKRAQTGVFLDVALNDYFVIEPVDGYPYQMRIRSMLRTALGSDKRYLGASRVCGVQTQDSCLGFYSKADVNAFTTWWFAPVNPCAQQGGTCRVNSDCCVTWGLKCVQSGTNKVCALPPQPPGLESAVWTNDGTSKGATVTLVPPTNTGGAAITSYSLFAISLTTGARYPPGNGTRITQASNVFFLKDNSYIFCAETWVFYAAATNNAGSSKVASFPDQPLSVSIDQCCSLATQPCGDSGDCCATSTVKLQCYNTPSGGVCSAPPSAPAYFSTAFTPAPGGSSGLWIINLSKADGFGLPIISYHVEAKSDKGDVATGFVTTNGQDTNGASITMSWTLYRNVLCNKIQKRWFYTTYAVSALGSSVKATNPAWFWDNDGIC